MRTEREQREARGLTAASITVTAGGVAAILFVLILTAIQACDVDPAHGASRPAEPKVQIIDCQEEWWELGEPMAGGGFTRYLAVDYDLPGTWSEHLKSPPVAAWRIELESGYEVVTTAACRLVRESTR